MFPAKYYYAFLVFAFVGVLEIAFFLYRIRSYRSKQNRKEKLKETIEKAFKEDKVDEGTYQNLIDILEK